MKTPITTGLSLAATIYLTLFAYSTKAEVVSKSKYHFHVKVESTMSVTPKDAYTKFLNVGQWWQSSHTWFGDASKMTIEPKANGCFCEVNGDKEALHMTVTHVNPGVSIKMLGGLGPLQGMGVSGVMAWDFSPQKDGTTTLILNYLVKGFTDENVEAISNAVDSVLTTQVKALQAYAQGSSL